MHQLTGKFTSSWALLSTEPLSTIYVLDFMGELFAEPLFTAQSATALTTDEFVLLNCKCHSGLVCEKKLYAICFPFIYVVQALLRFPGNRWHEHVRTATLTAHQYYVILFWLYVSLKGQAINLTWTELTWLWHIWFPFILGLKMAENEINK